MQINKDRLKKERLEKEKERKTKLKWLNESKQE